MEQSENQFILYVNFSSYSFQVVLPTENNRNYEIDLSSWINIENSVLSMEYFDGNWRIISNEYVHVLSGENRIENADLQERNPSYCRLVRNGVRFSVLLEALSEEHLHYTKYDIKNEKQILFGKDSQKADVVIDNPYISSEHARLINHGGEWFIYDCSKNGLYLNNQRLQQHTNVKLHLFDTVFTGGYQIVFLEDVIAINHASSVHSRLRIITGISAAQSIQPISHNAYLRSPRILEPLPNDPVEIEAPPSKQVHKKQPLLFVIGPALTTPLPMLVTMYLRMSLATSGSNLYWIMGVSVVMSAAIGLAWSLARRKFDTKEETETENQRQEAYIEYLKKNEKLLQDRHDLSRSRLIEQYPSSDDVSKYISQHNLSRFLWNRNIRFADFSSIRMGTGDILIPGDIRIPKERFSVTGDSLAELPAELYKKYHLITHMPTLLNLREHKLLGVVGDKDKIDKIAQNMVVQLSALHSYVDLRLAFLFDNSENITWTKWLPHSFTPDKKMRLLGNDEQTQQQVIAFLSDVIRRRSTEDRDNSNAFIPLYVVFCTQPKLLYNHPIYRAITDGNDYGVVFVFVYGRMDLLPNECTYIIQSDDEFNGAYSTEIGRNETSPIAFEYVPSENAEKIARALSKVWVNEISDGEIPDQIEFLDMYGVSSISEWNLIKVWKENRAYENIRGQIGVTYGGKPVFLDLHERQHGPHGLVAGTTGSGKSETIQTFILSLMLNYHPTEVSFVLIDYKGGGMANLFAGAPHIAGTITNIAASSGDNSEDQPETFQTQRALASLKSEIKQRQKIFNAYGVNHIDAYSKLYRQGKAREALPHLIIISDEFAELKKEQPEFIKELVSAARVGRSLGVHLILATQKPSGVVDDEIWSNSRFKLCLKVQDRQDSMEMLKRPEAAELTRTGQGYLQVGNDEIFELFQSGYSGAAYEPELSGDAERKNAIEFIAMDGTRTRKAKERIANMKTQTQLEACVAYIRSISEKNSVSNTRQLWLPLLGNHISLSDLMKNSISRFTAIVGKIDYPEQQSQPNFEIRFPQCGHVLVIGNAGSGKSTLIKTILVSLCCGQDAGLFQWYALDFSTHMFDDIKSFPHCGGVFYQEDEEPVKRLFQYIGNIIQERKQVLAKAGVSTADEYRRLNGTMPLTIIVIDNYSGFVDAYEQYNELLMRYLRDGISCGIHFVVSINTSSDMRAKYSQNFATTIPLSLNERSDYYNYLGTTPSTLSMGYPGSGLTVHNGSVVHFQTAIVDNISSVDMSVVQSRSSVRAPAIRYINKADDYAEFLKNLEWSEANSIPLGWHTQNITPYKISLWDTFCYFISDVSGIGSRALLTNLLSYAQLESIETHYVGTGMPLVNDKANVYRDHDEIYSLMSRIREVFKERSTVRKKYISEHGEMGCKEYMKNNFQNILVVFEDYNAFCNLAYTANVQNSYIAAFERMLKDGKDFGITFVAVWNKNLYQQNFQKNACQQFLSYKTGVHVGGKLDSQRAFDVNLSFAEQSKQRPPEEGFALELSTVSEVFIPPVSHSKEE